MPIKDWRELRAELQAMQTGEVTNDTVFEDTPQDTHQAELDYFEERTRKKSAAERASELQAGQQEAIADAHDWTSVADAMGYGDFRKDTKIPFDQWREHPVDSRAREQSQLGKITNGLVKMNIYAGTTFLDNTVGLLAGLLPYTPIGSVVEGVTGADLGGFLNNPFSRAMQNVRDWSEQQAPNYRTTEEMADQDRWWRHLNGNFWGDTFLKNIGFTIGAMGSGSIAANGFQKLAGREVNRAYRAAVAAADGSPEAAAALDELFGAGAKLSGNLNDDLARALKSYNRIGAESVVLGGFAGAIGEGRTEALTAAKEFHDEHAGKAQANYDYLSSMLENQLMQDERYVTIQPVYDGYGNIIDQQYVLNDAGKEELARRQQNLQTRYQSTISAIEREAETLANTTFALNLPILTASNMIMFGRMFSGGFQSQAKNALRGRPGSYRPSAYRGKVAVDFIKTGLSEGTEEMLQKMVSEGAKDIGAKNLAAFYDGKYDKDAIKDVSSWLLSMLDSAGNVALDPQSWEEFTIGLLTGVLMEGTQIQKNAAENIAARERQLELAAKLNERVSDPDFRAFLQGIVRHKKYENAKDVDLRTNNQFAWHTDDNAQLISDVAMFAEAGRIKDLQSMVGRFSDANLEDVPSLRGIVSDETDDDFNRKSDEQILDWIHQRAKAINETIKQYQTFIDSLDLLSFGSNDRDAITEVVFTKAQLQNFEKRYNRLLKETMRDILPTLETISKEQTASGEQTDSAKKASEILNTYGSFVSSLFNDSNESDPGDRATPEVPKSVENKAIKTLEDIGAFVKRPELKQALSDLQSLVRSRQEYYAKFFGGLRKGEEVEKAVHTTQEKTEEELQKEARLKKVDEGIASLKEAKSLREYANTLFGLGLDEESQALLDQKVEEDEQLKRYNDSLSSLEEFTDSLAEHIEELANKAESDEERNMLNSIMERIGEVDYSALYDDITDDADIPVLFSERLLNLLGGSPETQKVAYAIVSEQIADAAQIAKLGKFKPTDTTTDTGTGTGSEGTEGGSENTISTYSDLLDKIVSTTDLDSTLLKKISEGDFSDYKDLSAEERRKLQSAALDRIRALRDAAGVDVLPGNEEVDDKEEPDTNEKGSEDDPARAQAKEENARMETGSIRGHRFLNFIPARLKEGIKELFGKKKDNQQDGSVKALEWLRKRNAYDFVDFGALAELEAYYAARGEHLPIYILGNPFVDDSNPFAREYKDQSGKKQTSVEMIFAVEMNEENSRVLDNYKKQGFFTDDSLITVETNGKQIRYQVIGQAWNPSPDELKQERFQKNLQQYLDMKSLVGKTWELAVKNSIMPQFVSDRSSGTSDVNKWYVAMQPGSTSEQFTVTDGEMVVIPREVRKKNGEVAEGAQVSVKNNDGVLHVKTTKFPRLAKTFKLNDLGISDEEFLAAVQKDDDPGFAVNLLAEAKREGISFSEGFIRPDGSYEVVDSADQISYEGKIAEAILRKILPEHFNTGEQERMSTTLNYIQSGRNFHQVDEDTKIPLSESLQEYRNYNKKYYFGIATDKEVFTSAGAPEFPSEKRAPKGSLWLATQTANGNWSWTHLNVARVDEVDLEGNRNRGPVKDLYRALDTIFDKTAELNDKLKACKDLSEVVYLGVGNTASLFFDEEGNEQLVIGGGEAKSVDEAIRVLKAGEYRFQVSIDILNDDTALNNLIDTGILGSDMESFIRVNASFGVNFLLDSEDAPGRAYPLQNEEPVARTAGEYAFVFGDMAGNIQGVTIGEIGYQYNPSTGTVSRRVSKSKVSIPVTDKTIAAQVKALAELIHGDTEDYPGRKWIIDLKIPGKKKKGKDGVEEVSRAVPLKYTEMYEREIDGVLVHIVKRGKNGAYMLANNREWSALIGLAGDPIGPKYGTPHVSERAEQAELEQSYDALNIDPDRPRTLEDDIFGTGSVEKGKTAEEIERENMEAEEDFDCPI